MPATRSPFGRRLEHELGRIGLTQQQFADQLGVSQQTVSKWITGETTPRLRHLPRIEDLLGVATGSLSTLLFAPHTAPATTEPRTTAPITFAALRRMMATLTQDELALVESFVEGLFQNRS